jgi:uncharacterized protein VirK/YbjX
MAEFDVNSSVTRMPSAAATLTMAPARDRAIGQFFQFLKSFWAGTVYLILRLCRNNIFVFASRFRQCLCGETIVRTIVEHLEVLRVLNGGGARALIKRDPNYANKYFRPYLAKSFSKSAKRAILKFHHQFLLNHVNESFYERISQGGWVLWSETIEESRYAISMSFDAQWHSEGDVSLALYRNDILLYLTSFSIVPGSLIGCAAEKVIMVGRVHGSRGQAAAVRDAMHECQRIAPPHLLLVAVQAIAAALAIDTVAGVTSQEQLVKREQNATKFLFDYDAFWETFARTTKGAIVYAIPVPFARKEPPTGASRTKARRQRQRFKEQVAANVGAAFAREFVKTSRSVQAS